MRRSALLGFGAAALIMVGCSSTSTTSTGGDGTTTTTAAKVAKATFIEKADKICTDNDSAIGSQPKSESEADVKAFLVKGVESNRATIVSIKAIGVPDADADKLNEAIAAQSTVLDLIAKNTDAFAKDPSAMTSNTEISTASDKASAAAKAFGFKKCGVSSSSSSDGTTTTTTTGGSASNLTPDQAAKAYLSGISPNGSFTSEQIACVGTSVFSDATLGPIATSKSATVAEKKQLFSAMVDCIGPTFLIDAFMEGASQGKTNEQIACIKQDLTGLSKEEGIALVSGDPDAKQSFSQKITTDCG